VGKKLSDAADGWGCIHKQNMQRNKVLIFLNLSISMPPGKCSVISMCTGDKVCGELGMTNEDEICRTKRSIEAAEPVVQ
jgi:hypothetical protein